MTVKPNMTFMHDQVHDDLDDARTEIFEAVGDLSGIEIAGSQILLGCYLEPSITKGRIIKPADYVKEAEFQGKTAMILKYGNTAMPREKDPHFDTFLRNWGGRIPEIGDFVFHDVKACFQLSVRGAGSTIRQQRLTALDWGRGDGWPCRLVYVKDLFGRVPNPGIII